jgi:hemolysin D
VTVLNKDIGFVKKDMPVQIKVETFDFQKYGMFEGTVKLISKDSYEDEKQGMVFDVYVQPTTPFLMIEGLKQPLETGMTVTAEIKVGKRRIIEFIIYPLMKYMHEGMSVR